MPPIPTAAFADAAPQCNGDHSAEAAGMPHLSDRSGSPSPWDITSYVGLLALIALWAARVYATWAAWGNLTIDSGHEMYVPALLAGGKLLYRDVWWMYGPAAPYFNAELFRIFGVHLNVLYWAGSLSALGSAIFLYLSGMRLSSRLAGWTAGAVLVTEAFQPSLFCFPLPYSFAAVYGCLVGCLFLWLALRAAQSARWLWMLGAGTAAALALLTKPEFGMACYATIVALIAIRLIRQRSWNWKAIAKDLGAVLPGVIICAGVIRWMISIRGVEFITQENIVSWPTSFFMKTMGKMWLAQTGFTVTPADFYGAFMRAIPLAGVVLVACCVLWWRRSDARTLLVKAALIGAVVVYFGIENFLGGPFRQGIETTFATIFFPQDMVLYVIVAAVAACWFFWRQRNNADRGAALLPLLLIFSSCLAFRILMKMSAEKYSIYYNGPVVLSFLLIAFLLIPRRGRTRRFALIAEAAICAGCLLPVVLQSRALEAQAKDFVPLTTERGTIRVSKHMAKNYEAAIQFMRQKAAAGESVLSVPEDTSLYFLSGTYCPMRVFSFTPGVLAPGRMTDEAIAEIDEKKVRYLLWSNRIFPEFGVPIFGKDFDREIGDYLKAHYRRIGPLLKNDGFYWEWTAVVWERNPEAEPSASSK